MGISCDPVHQNRHPESPTARTTRLALRTARGGRVKCEGPIVASRAVVTTRVNNIEMAVLIATIWPNFEKGIIVQKNNGTVDITVVIALDTMATPT